MNTARRYYISGLVQGVGFRYATQRVARRLGLRGYVKNLPDGRVEVYAEGPEADLKRLEQWLWQGPSLARVERVEVEPAEPTGHWSDFEIRFA